MAGTETPLEVQCFIKAAHLREKNETVFGAVFGGTPAQYHPGVCTTYLDGVLLSGIPPSHAYGLVVCTRGGRCCGDGEVTARKAVPHNHT